MSIRFMTARAWMDEDGYHVWFAHDCVNGPITTMLPSQWERTNMLGNTTDTGRVEPSLHCGKCQLHVFLVIEAKPDNLDEVMKGTTP